MEAIVWSEFLFVCLMMFNATFNNISVISWLSVLFVEETGERGESHWPVASHWQTLSHNVVSSTPRHEQGFELTTMTTYALQHLFVLLKICPFDERIGHDRNYICTQCLSTLTLWVRIPVHGEVYSIQHYVIKFVSDLRMCLTFLWPYQ
jgi:hypothetical protein